jgi:CO dehydrogenase maturation factor
VKIGVSGKGGSGKSVIAALLAKSLAARGYDVLVVDADESNPGLQRMLGIDADPQPLMEWLGGKGAVQQRMIAAFFSGETEPRMQIFSQKEIRICDIPPAYLAQSGSIRLLRIGKIVRSLEGCACPMGVVARDFLTKLTLGEQEVALVDMEAGTEHFGRGVESGVNAVLVVVEPSFESVLLAEKINRLAGEIGVRAVAVLNKVTPDVEETLRQELQSRSIPVSSSIGYSSEVFRACLGGQSLSQVQAEQDITALINALGLK